MDNGQHRQSLQDSFATSITSGVGAAPEIANPSPDNLDTGAFEARNYGEIGNAVLNAPIMPPDTNLETDLQPESPEQRLGQIVDLPNSPMPNQIAKAPTPSNEQEKIAIDPAILEHFGDGEIDQSDIIFLKEKERELELADLNALVIELRKAMISGSKEANE